MRQINLLIKPVSGSCNLNCAYCFYKDEMSNREQPDYGIMSEQVLEEIIQKALQKDTRACTIGFQGGEPLLAGLPFFRRAAELARRYQGNTRVEFTVQTNGSLIDDQWADFFAEHHFLVGISLGGLPEINDRWRGQGTYKKTMDAVKILREKQVDFNILTVVTEDIARNAGKIYKTYKQNGFYYMQFIPCLDPLGEWGKQKYSLKPESYGAFLKELFDCWYADLARGELLYIRYFENLVGMLLKNVPESCNMRGICGMQNIIEADGSVYPCDFYVLDEYKLGNIKEDSFEILGERFQKSSLLAESLEKSPACKECDWKYLCRGGCRRNRDQETNRDIFCESYKMFFPYAYRRLVQIARSCM
ncbi:anaerobic sulfatase maturase [Anaerolentibacter hominis]|uniref:anaerobic sulfatase maturase n=1 Tax=Anaerolentibacter hominis TaxID=3079009 RepID=UPI0031B8AC98